MTSYSQRTISEGARGIGDWLPIMELISMICIPINVALLFWTGYKNDEGEEVTVMETYLTSRNADRWTNTNMLLLLIGMEHAILALKIVFAVLIPDVPEFVLFEEYRYDQVATNAKKEIQRFKLRGKHENYEEMLNRLTK